MYLELETERVCLGGTWALEGGLLVVREGGFDAGASAEVTEAEKNGQGEPDLFTRLRCSSLRIG